MFGLTGLTKAQRLVLGVIVLLVVDLIWVASSELTEVCVTLSLLTPVALFLDPHDSVYIYSYTTQARFLWKIFVESLPGIRENASEKYFLLFPQCFLACFRVRFYTFSHIQFVIFYGFE